MTQEEGEGTLLYSKEATGKHIEDWETFLAQVKNEIE
jgi:hypothetical protein